MTVYIGTLAQLAGIVTLLLAGAAPAAADASLPGAYGAGFRTVTVTRDPGLGTGTFTALLYYPATASGAEAPFDAAGGPYPAISFGHGFLQQPTQYRDPMAHLATHGYFVIASASETGLFPSHQQFANDLRSSLSWLEQQNANPASAYFGTVNTSAFGLSGHSMGGGCSIVAAAADARVRALAPLAPAETNVSAIGASASLACPVVFICGTQDTIVPTATNGQRMYDAARPARQLVSIVGGFHCGFTDASTFGCDSGGISRAAQQAITRRLLVEWFDLYLKDGAAPWRPVWGPESAGTKQVARTADAGFAITPAVQNVTGQMQTLTAPFTLTNLTLPARSFQFALDGQDRPAAPSPGSTPALDKGQTFSGMVQWSAPPEALTDELLITARSPRVDGGDGGTRAWAAITFEFTPPTPKCPGDANGDGAVNAADLSVLLGQFGTGVPPGSGADFNGDGAVDAADLSVLLGRFGTVC